MPLEAVFKLRNEIGLTKQQEVDGVWGHGDGECWLCFQRLVVTGTRKTKPCVACGQAGLREGILGWGGEKRIKVTKDSRRWWSKFPEMGRMRSRAHPLTHRKTVQVKSLTNKLISRRKGVEGICFVCEWLCVVCYLWSILEIKLVQKRKIIKTAVSFILSNPKSSLVSVADNV